MRWPAASRHAAGLAPLATPDHVLPRYVRLAPGTQRTSSFPHSFAVRAATKNQSDRRFRYFAESGLMVSFSERAIVSLSAPPRDRPAVVQAGGERCTAGQDKTPERCQPFVHGIDLVLQPPCLVGADPERWIPGVGLAFGNGPGKDRPRGRTDRSGSGSGPHRVLLRRASLARPTAAFVSSTVP